MMTSTTRGVWSCLLPSLLLLPLCLGAHEPSAAPKALPANWSETANQNILWKTKPQPLGWSSPAVAANRVFLTGADKHRRTVTCYAADTGKNLWSRTVPELAEARNDYAPDSSDPEWDELLYAAATPAANGVCTIALFSNGQLVALNAQTGAVLWNKRIGDTTGNNFGLTSSPRIYKDSVLVVCEGKDRSIARYALKDGATLWHTKRSAPSWASPLVAERDGAPTLIVLPSDPDITAWDAETGKMLWSTPFISEEVEWCVGPSAIQVGTRAIVHMQYNGMFAVNLNDGSQAWHIEELPTGSDWSDGSNATTDGQHIYHFFGGILSKIEAKTGTIHKQTEMDEYENYASPALHAGKLYLTCDHAPLLIVDADSLEVIGTGQLQDGGICSPALADGRIFVRGRHTLYGIGTQ